MAAQVLHAVCTQLREIKRTSTFSFACMDEASLSAGTSESGYCPSVSEETGSQTSVDANHERVPCICDPNQHFLLSLLLVSPCCRYKAVRDKVVQLEVSRLPEAAANCSAMTFLPLV